MSFLFPGKVERLLNKCIKLSYVLHVNYADGSQDHLSRVLGFDRDELQIEGFARKPREDLMDVFINELNLGFQIRVRHVSRNERGKMVYHCNMPSELHGRREKEERYLVFSKNSTVVVPDPISGVVLQLSVWDVTPTGMELINEGHHQYHQGFRFGSSRLQIDQLETLVNLEVTHHDLKLHGEGVLPILGCKFSEKPAALDKIMEACRRIDSLKQ